MSTSPTIYAVTSAGVQENVSYSSSATAKTVVYRTTGGVTSVETPTATTHATTKDYVDTALGLKAPIASPVFTGTISTTGTIIRLGTTGIMAALVTEVVNTIIDFGVNYLQSGSRVDASRGAYFRIDTRELNVTEVFSVTV